MTLGKTEFWHTISMNVRVLCTLQATGRSMKIRNDRNVLRCKVWAETVEGLNAC